MRITFALALLACLSLLACGHASAQDLNTALGEAESRAEAAAREVNEFESAVQPAERRFEASGDRAAPVKAAARAADNRVGKIAGQLRAHQLAAAAKVSRIEAERRDDAEKHDETVRFGLGLALAALIAVGIAVGWDWFRASALVAWLTRISLSQAIGLCVSGGLLIVIVGAAMSSTDGIVGVIGVALFVLGFVLANALVLARHSAQVQRGRSKPVLRRERLPRRVAQVTAGVLAALCLIGLGTAVFAGEDESSEASAELRHEAGKKDGSTPALSRAEQAAAKVKRKASALLAAANADRRDLRTARRELGHAEARLASAEGDADTFTRRLAALSAHEEREAQAEARRAEEQAQEEAEEAEELAAEQCNPNYSGCLDPLASDYDCEGGSGDGPLYTGTVEVLGYDEYGLDEDGDGIGCDP
jgi:hypothetical protein